MPYRVIGTQLGVLFHVPSGFVHNGDIALEEDRAMLERSGYKLESCAGFPGPKLSDVDLASLAKEASKNRRAAGARMREALAPLKKSFHLNNTM